MQPNTAVTIRPPQKFGVALNTLAEASRFAEIIVKSGLAPKGDTVETVLVKMQMGAEVGLAPMQAIQNISVINGRPSLWGDAMLAVCMRHRDWEGIEESMDGDVATCTIKRKGHEPYTATFSEADAKAAGLLGKPGPWTQYKRRMLQLRARGFALRDRFPDALRGLISREEATDYPIRGPVIINPLPMDDQAAGLRSAMEGEQGGDSETGAPGAADEFQGSDVANPGNEAQGSAAPSGPSIPTGLANAVLASEAQVKELEALLTQAYGPDASKHGTRFCKKYGIESVYDAYASQVQDAIEKVRAALSKRAGNGG